MRLALFMRLAALVLLSLALGACNSKATPMTPEESQRMASLTAEMTPRCVGRYLIDLPKAFVLNSESRTVLEDVTIEITPMIRAKFDLALAIREQELQRKHMDGEPDRPVLGAAMSTPQILVGKVFNRAQASGSAEFARVLELWSWRSGFKIWMTTTATDGTNVPFNAKVIGTPFEVSSRRVWEEYKVKNDAPERLTHLLNVYNRIRGRSDNEIPAEQGICFANGFLKGPPTDQEWVDMYHEMKDAGDVYFTYHYLSKIGPEETTLLQRGSEIETQLKKVNGATLRKGHRRGNGLEFDEWLARRESEHKTMLYDLTLELNSLEGNAAKPLFIVDLTSGVRHPGPELSLEEAAVEKPIEKATLGEAEAIALWDKVTATLRPRPGAF